MHYTITYQLICFFAFFSCTLNSNGELSAMSQNDNMNRRMWPAMKHHDIWNVESIEMKKEVASDSEFEFVAQYFDEQRNNTRRKRVIHLFPVPVDGECLSDDGRRIGICHNAYECRQKGGLARGDCAMGFGVCCIFIVNCSPDSVVSNNLTYFVSPGFPSFMPSNLSNCNLNVSIKKSDVSQLRIDFIHFSLGQPNRQTGVCEGDIFNISGGPGGTFSICGQNSGQHMYYEVGSEQLPRQNLYGSLRPQSFAEVFPNYKTTESENGEIHLQLHFANRFLPQRIWEMRITLIPSIQRAPPGCLQYHTDLNGVLQTFNFADNGRHLANQNYRICVRQSTGMCSIMYQPCDEQSFRIGPLNFNANRVTQTNMVGLSPVVSSSSINDGAGVAVPANNIPMAGVNTPGMSNLMGGMVSNFATSVANMINMIGPTTPMSGNNLAPVSATSGNTMSTPSIANLRNSTVTQSTTPSTPNTPTTPNTPNTPATTNAMSTSPVATTPTTPTSSSSTTTSTVLNDDLEDEGSGDGITPINTISTGRPGGGFDLLGFLRNALDLNSRRSRQLISNCRDRITMPCIIEDFIGTGQGPLPGCEPVHCGAQFCASGTSPCRIESTVTPFYVGVHFGEGTNKGSAEDNIGACLRYTQITCV